VVSVIDRLPYGEIHSVPTTLSRRRRTERGEPAPEKMKLIFFFLPSLRLLVPLGRTVLVVVGTRHCLLEKFAVHQF
jgi:hypothetical protein